uniref:BED-type domain-containing protein n=1 Tax=Ditylenchus dipsaci TaxID=166011 RepID=A0A915EPV0_9BILA
MVKPKHWCWQFFAKGKETTKAICKFCSASNRGHAGEMAHHLTNQCKKIGPEARKTIENLAGIKKKTEEPPASKVSKRGGSSFSSYQASSQSIASYFDQITEEEQAEFDIWAIWAHGYNEEVQAAMNLLSNKVSKNPAFIARENEIMIELAQWRSRTGIFAEGQRKFAWDALRATPPVDGLTFWTGFYSDRCSQLSTRRFNSSKSLPPQLKGIGRSGLLSTPKFEIDSTWKWSPS